MNHRFNNKLALALLIEAVVVAIAVYLWTHKLFF